MYVDLEKSFKFLTTSTLRKKILLSLLNNVKNLEGLKREIGSDSSTILHAVRDLENEDLLTEEKDGYHLTSIGTILASKISNLMKTLSAVYKNKEFWLNHQAEEIPPQFIEKIGMIKNARVIKATPTDLLRVLSFYREITKKAKQLKGISPIFIPTLPHLIEKIVDKGTEVKLIITDDILKEIRNKHQKSLQRGLNKNNFQLFTTNTPLKIALTVTEAVLSLGLFDKNGTYDFDQDLISHEKEAIQWGTEVFEYYLRQATRVKN